MKRLFSSVFWGAFIFSALWSQKVCANGTTIYVDADANGLNNGTSWTDAYTDLQAALSVSDANDEIWVARGTYKPTTDPNRFIYFVMKEGISLYGGFDGNETSRDQRNWIINQTILSADLLGNDNNILNYNEPTREDNSYHVVVGADNSTLDGFIISSGHANRDPFYMFGAGMYNLHVSPTVSNCIFRNNFSKGVGAGMFIDNLSNPLITNCIFINNYADQGFGGGIYIQNNSNPTIIDCTFEKNIGGYGGGGISIYQCNPVIANCKFYGNRTKGGDIVGGGGMHIWYSSSIIINCIFAGNDAWHWGGGIANMDSNPRIFNCTFSGNKAGITGGGIANWENCSPTLYNCIVWGNTPGIGQLHNQYATSTFTVLYSDIQAGWAGEGNINSDPMFMRNPSLGPDGRGGTADDDYGDMRLKVGSPCIDTGDNNSIPADSLDLDEDGNTTEKIPFDIAGRQRIRDGNCDGQTIVDMGAYEFYLIGDLKIDCKVNFPDIAIFANNWLQSNCIPANNWCSGSDIDRDGDADFAELSAITKHWLEESL